MTFPDEELLAREAQEAAEAAMAQEAVESGEPGAWTYETDAVPTGESEAGTESEVEPVIDVAEIEERRAR